jgi:hypothetical protein
MKRMLRCIDILELQSTCGALVDTQILLCAYSLATILLSALNFMGIMLYPKPKSLPSPFIMPRLSLNIEGPIDPPPYHPVH